MDWEKDVDDITNQEITKHGDLPREGYGYVKGSPMEILSEYAGRRIEPEEFWAMNDLASEAFGEGMGRLILMEIFSQQAPELIQGMGYHSFPHSETQRQNTELSFTAGFLMGCFRKKEAGK